MLKRITVLILIYTFDFGTCQKWEPARCIGDFGIFFLTVSLKRASIVLNIEWVQFVLQNCEILHSVWCLCDKNSASWYYFTSDVMYKKYERLVYTSPDLLARFCKVNLSNAKNSAWFVFLIYCHQEPLWLCHFFRCTYKAIKSM